MARKKSKQAAVGSKEMVPGQQSISKSPVSPGDAAGGGGGDAALDRLAARANQHTCCLLCHREFKDWGPSSPNGLTGGHGAKLADTVPALSQALLREVPGRKLADAVPSLSQSLLGEVPLWICQSCRKSVEEEERRSAQETPTPVPLSHLSSCKAQSCANGYPEQSSVDWDPSSFLSAHKLSGLWNSAHSNGHCTHASHTQPGAGGPACHEKRGSHEAPGKSAKTSGAKVCPYSHPSQNSSVSSPGNTLSASGDLCKTTPKHFKTMCRRPTPPGEAFHPNDHHPHPDLSAPPNSPTGLSSSSQHSSLLPPLKQSSAGQHGHITSSLSSSSSYSSPGLAAHTPFTLVPNLHAPGAGTKLGVPGGPDCTAGGALHNPCKNSHIPAVNSQHSKLAPSLISCNHPCNGHAGGALPPSNVGQHLNTGQHLSAGQHLTAGACRDQSCKGHKLSNGAGGLCPPPEEGEGEDEDSSSERSSCTSSSTNQKDGKYCDCCYCEFFGHNAPPAAPTSRNYAEIREKLRSRLTRRKEECLPQRQDSDPAVSTSMDHRDVNELLDFINSSEQKPANSAKAAKRARHKQKKKEKQASQGGVYGDGAGSDPPSTPPEPSDDPDPPGQDCLDDVDGGSESSRLLEWPQLELERVNSFLTSRLEEIKNTIKDSIRASFSMYDLNLDVNDFPKKAATLEGNHLLSHLNGSSRSELQQIDLDLAPLSLGTFKSHLDLVNGWEEAHPRDSSPIAGHLGPTSPPTSTTVPVVGGTGTAVSSTGARDVQRLHSTPSLSKLIRVRSPERCPVGGPESNHKAPALAHTQASNTVAKPKEEAPAELRITTTTPTPAAGANAGAGKQKKSKKLQQRQDQQPPELNQTRPGSKAGAEFQRTNGSDAVGPKAASGPKPPPHSADNQRTGPQKVEDARLTRQQANESANCTQRGRAEGARTGEEPETKGHSANHNQAQQQPKGKNKKNRNKGEKPSGNIDDVFLPKDVDPKEMDEIDREVEYFKRFCLDSAKQTRQKVAVNWSNFSLKKVPTNAAQ